MMPIKETIPMPRFDLETLRYLADELRRFGLITAAMPGNARPVLVEPAGWVCSRCLRGPYRSRLACWLLHTRRCTP